MKQFARILEALAFTCGLLYLNRTSAEGQRKPPNIIVIVSDDMGYADIGVHGSKDIPTPNIDALAKDGIRFTDAYVSGPYCSPTRAGLLTGRYQQRFGHEFNPDSATTNNDIGLPVGEITIADRLRTAGYRTALIGKWHLGYADQFHPMVRGFDEFFGFLGGSHSYLQSGAIGKNPLLDGRKIVRETTYLTDTFTDRAVDFINRQKSQPFFLYLAFNAVRAPMHATDQYLARFPNIADQKRRSYAAMLSAMDDGIGKVLATLRERKIEDNTLIIFLNDNGGPVMAGTTINGSSNAPLRGSKRQTWEGGIRVAFLMRWKGHLAEGKTDARPVIQLDVLPRALAAAGLKPQPGWRLDGVNLLPYLSGKNSGQPHEALFWRLGENMAIRKGDWKLVKTDELPLQAVDSAFYNDLAGAELYNLADDIGETKNLAAAYPDKVKELAVDWQRWNKELAKPLWTPAPQEGLNGRQND